MKPNKWDVLSYFFAILEYQYDGKGAIDKEAYKEALQMILALGED